MIKDAKKVGGRDLQITVDFMFRVESFRNKWAYFWSDEFCMQQRLFSSHVNNSNDSRMVEWILWESLFLYEPMKIFATLCLWPFEFLRKTALTSRPTSKELYRSWKNECYMNPQLWILNWFRSNISREKSNNLLLNERKRK